MSHATPSDSRGSLVSALTLKRPWLAALVVAVSFGVFWWWLHSTTEARLKDGIAEDLQTILKAEVAALDVWIDSQQRIARLMAADPEVKATVSELVRLAENEGPNSSALKNSQAMVNLRRHLNPVTDAYGFACFVISDRQHRIIGCKRDYPLGQGMPKTASGFLDRVLTGEAAISKPIYLPEGLQQADFTHHPVMSVSAPVSDEDGRGLAVLTFSIRPELDFTRILSLAQAGNTGETYAFDERGLLISRSRFEDQLARIKLIPPEANGLSILSVDLRDPGGNLLEGFSTQQDRKKLPLMRPVKAGIAGESGIDVEGFRDYRGVPVVGAWTWLPQHGFGVVTQMDTTEAYQALHPLRRTILLLVGLLALSLVGVLTSSYWIAQLRRRMRHAVLEARKLGQYTLQKKIGAGGMGEVYRAEHALLRRPTAIKLLSPDRNSERNIARFEREVQLTCQLTHPNTIVIYDFGRTPEGVFYYAMEYLDGIPLDRLIRKHGPQSPARVIHILRQMCASLREAHEYQLIHRDVKPANVILCQRGGEADVVKVLDFGLIKDLNSGDSQLTEDGAIAGTPHYLAPEAILRPQEVDGRTDLYAVGAVGYFLLTGEPVFDGDRWMTICSRHVNDVPQPPSDRLGQSLPEDLESVILKCLAKQPEDRYQSADEMLQALEACVHAPDWNGRTAQTWWEAEVNLHVRLPAEDSFDPDAETAVHSVVLDVGGR